jgi:glucose/arabinose dehydrogenase
VSPLEGFQQEENRNERQHRDIVARMPWAAQLLRNIQDARSKASAQPSTRTNLALDPKTGAMFVGVGSAGNIGVEPEVKASIQRFEADGSSQTTFASGMRNPTDRLQGR